MTPTELEAFQRSHRNHLGQPLEQDGILGPETRWARDFLTLPPERRAPVVAAQAFIGLEESPPGSNDDPAGLIREWLQLCHARPGDPWCASFLSRCLGTVRIASAQQLGRHFPATSEPLCGDVMWYPTTGAHGHCGLVIGVSPAEVMTVEGNSDNAVRCLRRPRQGLHFARAYPSTLGTCPGVVGSVPPAHGGTR